MDDEMFGEAEMGLDTCRQCGETYQALPGFINDGHQCDADGTAPEFELPAN